jgi:hypothetical protein
MKACDHPPPIADDKPAPRPHRQAVPPDHRHHCVPRHPRPSPRRAERQQSGHHREELRKSPTERTRKRERAKTRNRWKDFDTESTETRRNTEGDERGCRLVAMADSSSPPCFSVSPCSPCHAFVGPFAFSLGGFPLAGYFAFSNSRKPGPRFTNRRPRRRRARAAGFSSRGPACPPWPPRPARCPGRVAWEAGWSHPLAGTVA